MSEAPDHEDAGTAGIESSPREPTQSDGTSAGFRRLLALLALLALAGLLVLDHLDDDLWHDEAYTLLHYSDAAPTKPFLVYDLPNNHVLFSALLAVWSALAGTETVLLRLLPAGMFLGALVLLVLTVERACASLRAGLLAGLLLATSHLALVHATLLRGYGAAWLPITGGLLALIAWRARGGAGPALAYVATGALAVGLIPTNGLAFVVLGGWALATALVAGKPAREVAVTAALAAGAAAAGGIFYVAIAREVVEASRALRTGHTVATLLGAWGSALLDLAWLLPLVAAGALLLGRQARARGRPSAAAHGPGAALLLFACVLVLPVAVVTALPSTPFPRTLVPLLPLLFAAIAVLAEPALGALDRWRPRAGWIGLLLVAAGLVGGALWRERVRAWQPRDALSGAAWFYDPYYRHDGFRPAATVDRVAELSRTATGGHPPVVLIDDTDVWAILAYWRADIAVSLYVGDGNPMPPEMLATTARAPVLVVTSSPDRGQRVAREAGLPGPVELELVEDLGVFEIHRVR